MHNLLFHRERVDRISPKYDWHRSKASEWKPIWGWQELIISEFGEGRLVSQYDSKVAVC